MTNGSDDTLNQERSAHQTNTADDLHAPFTFWTPERRTFEGYMRTDRHDWFDAVRLIVNEIGTAKRIIDIGSGDGHSTRQILARLQPEYLCDILEPDPQGIAHSRAILKECSVGEMHQETLHEFLRETRKQYDIAMAIHSNYYWGCTDAGQTKFDRRQYDECLGGLVKIARKVLILTVPEDSDYNSVMIKPPFPEWTGTEHLVEHYRTIGMQPRIEPCHMKFYTGDIGEDESAAREVWKFFHNTERDPSRNELADFVSRAEAIQDERGNIDFKDELIVVELNPLL
jgi:hypothetical protein